MTSAFQKLTRAGAGALLSLLALAAPAMAQKADAAAAPKDNLIAADPLFVVQIDGPDRLATTFRPTNVGKMVSGQEFKDLLAPFLKMVDMAKEQARKELPIDLEALQKAAQGYGGRVTLAAHIVGKVDFRSKEPPFGFTLVMAPDGKTDLKGLCEKVGKLAEEDAANLSDVEVEGKTFRALSDRDTVAEDSWAATLPFMHNGNVVLCMSTFLKTSLKMLLNPDQKPRYIVPASLRTASFGFRVNVERLVAMIEEGTRGQYGDGYQGSMPQILLDNTGFRSLKALELTCRPDTVYVASETAFEFNDRDRGLLAALFPKSREVNPLNPAMPRTTSMANSFYFNPMALYKGVKKIWNALEEGGQFLPMSWEEIEKAFEENMDLRLEQDFLAHIGPYHLIAQQVATGDGGQDVDFDDPDGTCVALLLTNAEAMGKNLEKMLRKQGLHAARKTEDYKGQKVHRLQVGDEIHYAVADRLLLLGFGKKGGEVIRAVLNAEADVKAGKEPPKLSPGLAARLDQVKRRGDPMDVGWVNINAQIKSIVKLEDQLGFFLDIPQELRGVLKLLEKVPPILKTYKANEQLSIMRNEGNRFVTRTLW